MGQSSMHQRTMVSPRSVQLFFPFICDPELGPRSPVSLGLMGSPPHLSLHARHRSLRFSGEKLQFSPALSLPVTFGGLTERNKGASSEHGCTVATCKFFFSHPFLYAQVKRQCMAAFVVLNSALPMQLYVLARLRSLLGNPCRHGRFCSRTYAQLFQVDVTFAFVSADHPVHNVISCCRGQRRG